MKKSKIFLMALFTTIIILLIVFGIILLNNLFKDGNIVKGYYKSEIYGDKYGFQHYTEYYKYYYSEKNDMDFYKLYSKVNDENIDEIKLYYNEFKERMNAQNRLDEYDFNEKDIDENDYFILYDKNNRDYGTKYAKFYNYIVYYYDTNLHILYVLHNS